MSGRRFTGCVNLTVVIGVALACSLAMGEEVVVKYVGTHKGTAGGHSVTMLEIASMDGAVASVPIPNDTGKTPMPDKKLMEDIKKLNPDDVIKVGIESGKTGLAVSSIEPYDAKPGENTPNGYIFEKTTEKSNGKMTVTTVILTKFGKEYPFTIAKRRNPDTKMEEQDPDVVDAVGKLQEGNSVWALTNSKKILVAIEPYTDPLIGKIVKIGTTDVDGHKVPSADIETDNNKTVTVLVPVKPVGKNVVPDAQINQQLHAFHPQSAVLYRVHEDTANNRLWLLEVLKMPTNVENMAEKPSPKKKTE